MKTMALISVVVRMTSLSEVRLKWPLASDKSMAPTAPTEAASVGVATPKRIEPSTPQMRTRGGDEGRAEATEESRAENLCALLGRHRPATVAGLRRPRPII